MDYLIGLEGLDLFNFVEDNTTSLRLGFKSLRAGVDDDSEVMENLDLENRLDLFTDGDGLPAECPGDWALEGSEGCKSTLGRFLCSR